MMLIVIVLGVSVSFGTQYTPHFKILLAASLPLHIRFFGRYIIDPSGIGTIFSVLGSAFSVWMIANGRKSYQIFAKSLETQIDNEELAARLGSMHDGLEA